MKIFDHISGSYLQTGRAKIFYEEIGKSDRPVLLLLHGGFGNMEDFNILIPCIKPEFRLIGVDSRGQGKSTLGDGELTYELIQHDIELLMKHLQISEVNIIGFSDGGIVAYRLACFSDLKIKKLITIGSRWHKDNALATKEILRSVTSEKWRSRFPGMVETYERMNPEPNFDNLVGKMISMWMNERSYPNEYIRNIKADTLVIRGDKDHLVKRKFVFDIVERIENASLCNIAFAGHAAHLDAPEVVMLALNRFLSQ